MFKSVRRFGLVVFVVSGLLISSGANAGEQFGFAGSARDWISYYEPELDGADRRRFEGGNANPLEPHSWT